MHMKTGPDALTDTPQDAVTLLDVAREAGVSPATVSRILNGTAKVADDKRKAVEDAILALNFRPNLFARSLKTGVTMTVGVLTQAIQSPFYAYALKGIEVGLDGSGYSPLIVSGHWDPALEAARVRLLMSRRIDGLIVLTGRLSDEELLGFARNQPVVVTERLLQGPNVRAIKLDQQRGGYMATAHLIGLGHQRIAHIGGLQGRPDSTDRYAGYLQAHQEAGLTPDPELLVMADYVEAGGQLAMNQLLDRGKPFTAVFCANDDSAFGARKALYCRGLRVPEDVSLVGFDDLPIAPYMTPPLTTIRQPIYEVGLFAARALLNMMGCPATEITVPSLALVERETTARP